MAFIITSSPHGHSQQTTANLMRLVMLAMLPGILTQWFLFGWGTPIQIGLAAATALASEALILWLRGRPVVDNLFDSSALLTGLLLAVALPPLAPWWLVIVGTAFAIIIAKQLYGGLGDNPFNPAMVGYVLLLVSFPGHMTGWQPPVSLSQFDVGLNDALSAVFSGFTLEGYSVHQLKLAADGVTMATPLDSIKTALGQDKTLHEALAQPIFDAHAGIGWQWVNLAYLLGGLFLLATRNIAWQIPLAILASLGGCALIAWSINPDIYLSPLLQLASGATMLGAFFIATDPVTAATTPRGRLLYGALIGVLIFVIRTFGGYPDGVAFAVLLTNIAVPMIDSFTRPRVYGENI